MNPRFLILLTSVTVFFACNRKGCTDPLAINYEEKAKKDDGSCVYEPQTEVTVHFNHIFNSQTLNSSVFDDLIYTNAAGTVLSISKLKYHISDFRFYKTNGDSLMTDEYHFVDLSQNGTLTYTLNGPVFQDSYAGFGFIIGFNQEDNISGLYADLNAENWGWPESLGGGYHHLQLEGRYINSVNDTIGYAYHSGSTIKKTDGATVTYPENYIWVKLPFSEMTFGSTKNIYLTMNVAEWFENPNTWDLNILYNGLMDDYDAQIMMRQNGADVFTLDAITD